MVDAGADSTVDASETLSQEGTFFDPGADTFMVSWDFCDDSSAARLLADHAWTEAATHTVILTATDDDGGA